MTRKLILVTVACGLIAGSSAAIASSVANLGCRSVQKQANGLESLRGCSIQSPPGTTEDSARAFLEGRADALGLAGGQASLELIEVKYGLASSHVRFRQLHLGAPIYGSQISVHTGRNGDIQRVHRALNKDPIVAGSLQAGITGERAVELALAAVSTDGLVSTHRNDPIVELVWFPAEDGTLSLAWKATVFVDQPLGDYLSLVDAADGRILLQENRIAFGQVAGSGLVFSPNPFQTIGLPNSIASYKDIDLCRSTTGPRRHSRTQGPAIEGHPKLQKEICDKLGQPFPPQLPASV